MTYPPKTYYKLQPWCESTHPLFPSGWGSEEVFGLKSNLIESLKASKALGYTRHRITKVTVEILSEDELLQQHNAIRELSHCLQDEGFYDDDLPIN